MNAHANLLQYLLPVCHKLNGTRLELQRLCEAKLSRILQRDIIKLNFKEAKNEKTVEKMCKMLENYIKNNSDGKLTPEDVASKVKMELKFGSSFMQNLEKVATQNDLNNNDANEARKYLLKNAKLRNLLYRAFDIDANDKKSKVFLSNFTSIVTYSLSFKEPLLLISI